MRLFRKVINYFIWAVVTLFIVITVAFHIPVVQNIIGAEISSALSHKLGTRVEIGRVDLGFLNRVVIDNVRIYDQQHQKLLFASRLGAKIDILPLFEGKISVSSTQLFGLDANLYRMSADGPTNFQFVLDSLASKDTTSHTPLDLRISSLVIRNGKVGWNDYSKRKVEGLDVNHLEANNISAHILLNHLTDDAVDVSIRRFSLNERSGLSLRQLAFKLKADKKSATITNFILEMPRTRIEFPLIQASYRFKGKTFEKRSLRYSVNLSPSYIAPSDLAFLDPALQGFSNRLKVSASVSGTADNINVKPISIEADDQSILVKGQGGVSNLGGTPRWSFSVLPLKTSADGIQYVARNLRKHNIEMPDVVSRLGNIDFKGKAEGQGKHIKADGNIRTSAGDIAVKAEVDGGKFNGKVSTPGFDLGRTLDNADFGKVVADVQASGVIPSPFKFEALSVTAKGNVNRFDYHGYSYRNVSIDGTLDKATFNGIASINDPNGKADIKGTLNREKVLASIDVQHFNPHALKLTDALGNRTFSLQAKANLAGKDLNTLNGTLDITDFSMIGEGKNCSIGQFHANVRNNNRRRVADVVSDFGEIHVNGIYDYQTIPSSIYSIIDHHLPSLLAGNHSPERNAFSIHGKLLSAKMLRDLLGIPLHISGPVNIDGTVNDAVNAINLRLSAPDIVYSGNHIRNAYLTLTSGGQADMEYDPETAAGTSLLLSGLNMSLRGERVSDNGTPLAITLNATANNDNISLKGNWDMLGNKRKYGTLNADASLFRNGREGLGVSVDVLPSEEVFDTIHVAVQPSHFTYKQNLLDIDHFEVSNGEQHVTVNGQTTGSQEDSLLVDFRNINLKYVLDLVGFNSVRFTGNVTGKGYVKSFFKNPKAYANFDVADFRFQDGEFGTLHAKVNYDNSVGRININSVAEDGPDCYTNIDGYVSIKEHYMNLPMECHRTKMQFLEGFASAVLDNVKATGDGNVRIFGDMSHVNMDGDVVCNGDMMVKQTQTTYTMRNSHIHIIPNEIEFVNDSIYDRDGNLGIISGGIHHKEFHKWTFDIDVDADRLLCLNLPEFGDNTFRGIIYGSGHCDIIGRSGETTINANLTPVGNSYMEYDAGYSGSLDDNSFIHWNDVTAKRTGSTSDSLMTDSMVLDVNGLPNASADIDANAAQDVPNIPGDFTMNLLINTTPDFTLRVLMDESTGDHMDFHGNGVVRATYFNKGAFQMFGNYNVEFGTYVMTIQNLVKKTFTFLPGSSITFGGNPFDAQLNVKAQYTVNGVSLSDLQMGRSFASNNIRVNCLMNILGTPLKPNVTFGIDFPTLSTDAQQMVRSVMESEQDMNQQVLYLLAVGRFYNPGNNNAEIEKNSSQSQTSLAMQSVLSGALSQQLSNVMSTVLHNTNWNIGANISTGDEGFSDAEYEGLLSGRMLNNRLFFQGQFGYRDNVTTNNSSFIGDFDLRYLLTPNGNVAVRVYNQTNDRYFTRNSLTTQGIGFILKKDFNGWRDFLGIRKNKKKKK